MLGDAAGNISPVCGNGMSMAMNSSCIAFDLICEHLENKISIKDLEYFYECHWNYLFSDRIKTGKHIQHFFGKERLTNISVGILKKAPMLTDKLISITHGSKF